MNQVTLVGRIVRKPELRESENKRKMTFITVAVNRPFKNINGVYETDFIDCILWENVASNVVEYCNKGDVISVRGRLQTRVVENEENEKRTILEVVGERISFISTNKKQEDENINQ